MRNESKSVVVSNHFLEPGYILITKEPTAISTVLGSCVAVCIYDRKRKVGGMNHFQFPYICDKHKTTARYGNVATIALIHMMINNGSEKKHLEAQIFGGAHSSAISQKDIGRENVKIARKALSKKKVRIVSEDVEGEKGRKIVFNSATNEIAVLRVDKIRKADWHPYESDRFVR